MNFVVKRVLPAVAVYFFVVALVSVMDVARYYREIGLLPWPYLGYIGLDLLRGTGVYFKERWLLYLSLLHAVAYTALNVAALIASVSPGLPLVAVNSVLSWGLWLLLYIARHDLKDTKYSKLEAVLFLCLWSLMFYYAVTQTFTNL